jgi:hypothetical protein
MLKSNKTIEKRKETQKNVVARNRKLKALSDWQFWQQGKKERGIIFF